MYRPASRLIARSATVHGLPRATAPARRFLSTAPPTQKSRSWKSLAVRFGIAGSIIYYYSTIDVFAEEPSQTVYALPESVEETEKLPTIEALAQERQRRKVEAAVAARRAEDANAQEVAAAPGVAEGPEEEAEQQGAFNPETGEINWDCPCLGGMAQGPCGEEFKAAFSCFVYSTDEPKGMDCIEKFKGMQNCFREYPEIYGAELENDEDEESSATSRGETTNAADDVTPYTKVAPQASSQPDTAESRKNSG